MSLPGALFKGFKRLGAEPIVRGISGIYADLYSRLASDQSLFPAIPERTLRLRQTLSDPNCSIAKAAKLVQTEFGGRRPR